MSPVTIKYATSRPGVSHPLVSSLNNTTSRHLFTEKDILFWNLRRGRGKGHGGRKPTSKAMTRERLYYTAERNLRHRIALMIEQGDMPASTFRSLYLKVTGQGAPDTDDPDVLSALPAMRIHLVEILSEVGKQLEMAGNHG